MALSRDSIKVVLTLLLVMTLINSNYHSTAQNVSIPNYIEHQETIPTGVGNDIYFRTNPVDSILPSSQHQLEAIQGSSYLYNRYSSILSYNTNLAKNSIYSSTLIGNALYQSQNYTADELEVSYHAGFYDLLAGTNGASNDMNKFLQHDKYYHFQFDVAKSQMLYFALLFSQGSSYFFIQIVDSEGHAFTFTHGAVNNEYDYIPMFALAGHYIGYIYSYYNVVLQDFSILNNLDPITVSDGYSEESFTGTASRIKMFQTQNNGIAILKAGSTTRTSSYMGSISIYVFDDTQTSFGNSITSSLKTLMVSKHAYFTVVVTPPNEKDPYVQKYKKLYKIPEGFNVDYSFFVEARPIQDLPINQNVFPHQSVSDDNYEYFRLVLSEETILSYNASSTNADALVVSSDLVFQRTLSASSYDVLNSPDSNILLLPAGEYIIGLASNYYHYFTTFSFQNFERETTQTMNLMLNRPQFYKVVVNSYNFVDSFNITYPDQLNRSADFYFTYYNSYGTEMGGASSFTMDHFYGNGTLRSYNNQTLEQFSTLTGPAATESYFIRIEQYGNVLYNTTYVEPENSPVLDINDPNYVPTLNVALINAINTITQNDPNIAVIVSNLEDGFETSINSTKNNVYGYFNFVPEMDTVYRIIFTTTNITLTRLYLYRGYGETLDLSPSSYGVNDYSYSNLVVVNATTSYTEYELDFLAVDDMTHGIYLSFDTSLHNDNANMIISIETGTVYTLNGLPITSFTVGSTNGGITNNLLTQVAIGGAIALIVAIPVVLIARNSRKKV